MKKRIAKLRRVTTETDIRVRLNLDGRGRARVRTGIRFFDHMLELVARHGALDLNAAAFEQYYARLRVGDRLVKEKGSYLPRAA